MNLPLSDLAFQNNGSGQMCHVLGHGNLPKKQQQQINFLLKKTVAVYRCMLVLTEQPAIWL